MAEILGLVASVVQLAGAGLKLSQALYQYADGVATADRRIKNIANEVKLTSLVIQELGDIFKQGETANLISENAVKTANATINECSSVFMEIEVIINKSKPGKMGRLMLPFRDNKIELMRSQIDKLKSTLELLMQVLIFAQQSSSSKLSREAEAKQREEIKQLLESKKKTTQKYEESLGNFSISDSGTAVDDGEWSLLEDDESVSSSSPFKAALAMGSTINPETLATCVSHVRSLLADIETLQVVLTKKVDGDDHSDYHQKAVESYFLARTQLDSVLLGNSKTYTSQTQSQQQISVQKYKSIVIDLPPVATASPSQRPGATSSGSYRPSRDPPPDSYRTRYPEPIEVYPDTMSKPVIQSSEVKIAAAAAISSVQSLDNALDLVETRQIAGSEERIRDEITEEEGRVEIGVSDRDKARAEERERRVEKEGQQGKQQQEEKETMPRGRLSTLPVAEAREKSEWANRPSPHAGGLLSVEPASPGTRWPEQNYSSSYTSDYTTRITAPEMSKCEKPGGCLAYRDELDEVDQLLRQWTTVLG